VGVVLTSIHKPVAELAGSRTWITARIFLAKYDQRPFGKPVPWNSKDSGRSNFNRVGPEVFCIFTIEVWTRKGLIRFLVFFFIDLFTRKVEIAGIASRANGLWMSQVGRRATDAVDGILNGKCFLIDDRDPLFTTEFQNILTSVGVQCVKLPARSPNLNAHAERFVRSIKESCLGRLVLFGEASLRRAIREFVVRYHQDRNHQGLGNRLIASNLDLQATGAVSRRELLRGTLNYYYRAAA
jgi:putative transposase